MTPEHNLHAVLFPEGGWWIAQVVEYNLATAARRLEDLPDELERFLTVQIVGTFEAGVEPFCDLPAAPVRFRDLYAEAARSVEPERRLLRLPAEVPIRASVEMVVAQSSSG
jgi:hypothetical protein